MHNTPTVSLALRSYSGQVELHDHHFHQIVLPQSGAMQIELDGRAGQVDWRQGVVIPAGARHAFMAQSNNSFLVLDVPLAQTVAGPLSEQRFFAVAPDIRHLLDYASRSAPLMLASPALAASWSTLLLASLTHTPAKPPSYWPACRNSWPGTWPATSRRGVSPTLAAPVSASCTSCCASTWAARRSPTSPGCAWTARQTCCATPA